jgi:hypothetical protein
MRKAILLASLLATPAWAEVFIDIGLSSSKIESRIANQTSPISRTESSAHFGLGARRSVGERHDFAVRVEIDRLDSDLLLAFRALDYRYHLSDRFAVSGFLGAARLDLGTPAYGYYLGGGGQWKDVMPGWDLNLDLRIGDKVARDNLLPTDPQGGSPDNFHDISGVSLYLSYSF